MDNNRIPISKKEYDRLYYLKNKEKRKIQQAKYIIENKEKIKTKQAEYIIENKEKIKSKKTEYYLNNKEQIIKDKLVYQKLNKQRINNYKKEWRLKNKEKDIQYRKNGKETAKLWRSSNKTSILVRHIFRIALKRYTKNGKTKAMKQYGVDIKAIVEHLGQPPQDGKKYHIDHIFPVSAFDLENPEHIKLCWHPDNLQWLEASENCSKKDKYDKKEFENYIKIQHQTSMIC
jgi:hypothetical protein